MKCNANHEIQGYPSTIQHLIFPNEKVKGFHIDIELVAIFYARHTIFRRFSLAIMQNWFAARTKYKERLPD